MNNFKLAPSDFGFLWDECKRCFWLKVRGGFPRPSTPFPGIFTHIDLRMKDYYQGRRTEEIGGAPPAGTIEFGEKWVESAPIALEGLASTCYIRGKFDTVLKLDDGSWSVADFKTSRVAPGSAAKYGRQLHAYALALEHAAPRKFALAPVSRLGLMVFEPSAYGHDEPAKATLTGPMTWLEIPRDDAGFRRFLAEVVTLLESDRAPEPGEKCVFCRYREESRARGV
ncbi:MAG TPA: PD-(D/E)XK nuclease family protein [Gemmatimonadaceae bacterium]|nr:PD-(D/E)XK nuclease family protein [Gemmatimonadaceae bacterium]